MCDVEQVFVVVCDACHGVESLNRTTTQTIAQRISIE